MTIDVAILNDGSDRTIDIAQGALGQAVPVRRYTHSANVDEPLQVETFTAAGSFDAAFTYHADHLGSVRYLTDSSGTIVNAYDYDSYGRPMFGVTAFDQPFAYTGREWDAAAGLYHYRARAYDAETGRFLQEDPIGFISGDLNIYRYVGSNPVLSKDPSGLVAISSARINRQGKRIVGRAELKLTPRISCLFSLAGDALELATSHRVDGIIETAEKCTLKVKPRLKSKGNPNHGNSVSNPKRQFYVYVIYEGTSIIKVGKGKGKRAKSQSKDGRKHIKIAKHLTVAEALALECTIVWAAILAEQKLSGDFSACARKAKG